MHTAPLLASRHVSPLDGTRWFAVEALERQAHRGRADRVVMQRSAPNGYSNCPAATLPGVPPEDARTFHGILLWPNVHLMFIPDHVMCMRFEPVAPARTRVITQWLFHPDSMKTPGFSPDDSAALVDVTAREDFEACERVQNATASSYFEEFHTPHESLILDFRKWVHGRLHSGLQSEPAESLT
ncbi:SRPBCC family protein [Streptomyces sp. NPDC059152]|uniref:SRPBCC family protein n=1 Tax=Streptomyces sp. NPDC059152 TaxID=3346742 RepID=UPI003685779F